LYQEKAYNAKARPKGEGNRGVLEKEHFEERGEGWGERKFVEKEREECGISHY